MSHYAEATPDGVKVMFRNDAGNEAIRLIAYDDAVNRLGAGEYDDVPDEGYAIHCAVADGGDCGYFNFTTQQTVTMWRWLIAAAFIADMKRKNGVTTVTESGGTDYQVGLYINGNASLSVCQFAVRLAMATHIEGAMIECYGTDKGIENAIAFYITMLDVNCGELTTLGRDALVKMFHQGGVI